MTLASILGAIVAGIVGGTATVVAAKIDIWPHIISIVLLCITMNISLYYAIHAARPTEFCYAGNNPAKWADDVGDDENLIRSLAEQASLYAKGIETNSKVLDENHRCIRNALWWLMGGLCLAMSVESVVILSLIGAYGLNAVLGK